MKIGKVPEYINILSLNIGIISDVINGIRLFLSCSKYIYYEFFRFELSR